MLIISNFPFCHMFSYVFCCWCIRFTVVASGKVLFITSEEKQWKTLTNKGLYDISKQNRKHNQQFLIVDITKKHLLDWLLIYFLVFSHQYSTQHTFQVAGCFPIGERRMLLVTVTFVKPWKELWPSWCSNSQPLDWQPASYLLG